MKFIWILILGMGHGNAIIDGFKDKKSCEMAFISIKQQIEQDNNLSWQASYHTCVQVQK